MLFLPGPVVLHSGQISHLKVECDAITPDEWAALAQFVMQERKLRPFGFVYGVPRGGIPFAEALEPYGTRTPLDDVLVVDDVLTTGASLLHEMSRHPWPRGLVLFARGPLPPRVSAVWNLGI